jgi:nucleotide-binding universal stress UspA family protein
MNKILIPVDFEKQSLIALEQSFSLAHLILAEITLLYVHEPSGIFASIFSDDQKNEMLILIDERLAEMAGKASISSGITVTYRLEKGRISSKIIEVAKEINAQFIFMGSNSSDKEDLQERQLGTNTLRVLRSAKCPVITFNTKPVNSDFRNILLPLDLTKESRQKVTMGIEIARYYGAGIKLVSALGSKSNSSDSARLYQQGAQVTDFISSAGIGCTFELLESTNDEKSTVPSILNYAKQSGDIDLIIVLTQQEAGLVEYFVGSDALEIIRLSDIPVMSIIPMDLGFTSLF